MGPALPAIAAQYPDLAISSTASGAGNCLPAGRKALPTFSASATGMSTRDASGKVLNALAEKIPWLLGGAADLSPSTKTRLTFEFAGDFRPRRFGEYRGRNFHFGIREHAMCAIVNGMVLTGLRAFGSGFLIFTDYARGAIRLSSLMDLPVLHIWTHDSISLGEDGPTHQPIEQLFLAGDSGHGRHPASRRQRDGGGLSATATQGPTRRDHLHSQALPRRPHQFAPASGVAKGGYVLVDAPDGKPDVILIGSGSEVRSAYTPVSA